MATDIIEELTCLDAIVTARRVLAVGAAFLVEWNGLALGLIAPPPLIVRSPQALRRATTSDGG